MGCQPQQIFLGLILFPLIFLYFASLKVNFEDFYGQNNNLFTATTTTNPQSLKIMIDLLNLTVLCNLKMEKISHKFQRYKKGFQKQFRKILKQIFKNGQQNSNLSIYRIQM
eukprot:TRINITY_DN5870_c0_g2_i1.p4 TRINITY_DN5870_c0_g2~~TRINITY_DN5870_c0_g2_i1.p4  ORF type:complete len:111 (-),score=7.37 TRINITY_DN5870_c0_g2_i1:1140-1472(-)